jgi:hypothetical protein
MNPESLIHKQDGYRELKSCQVAEIIYDVVVAFCERFIDMQSQVQELWKKI